MKFEARSSSRGHIVAGSRARGLAFALLLATSSAVAAQDVGFEGPGFSPASATPTESKPENKLWYNDGFWWGSLWSTSGNAFRIHRLDFSTHAWVNTGPTVDSRSGSHSDCLWDGTKLYILSHQFVANGGSSGNPMTLQRFSYNSSTDAYSLDSGFPVNIGTGFSTEAMVIDKDSTGTLWAAWTQGSRVQITHSNGADTTWVSTFVLPVNTTNLNVDDICSVTAFGGNKIGVLWSDQTANAYRFSVHTDGTSDTTWSAIENVSSGETDDHLNLATDSTGKVYVAGKNAANNLLLYVRATNGTWSRFIITQPTPILTRPCVILNETAGTIHVFATGQDTGEVFEKTSPMSSINFGSGTGTIRMKDSSTVFRISNPSSTKQNWDAASGLVILAHHDTTGQYWHHEVAPVASAPVANFTASPTSGAAPLNVTFTDTSTGSISSRSWSFGDGSTSTSTNPSHSYSSAGSYTVSLTVTGSGGSDTETKTNFITVTTPAPVADFTATPTSGAAPLNVSFTDTSTGSISSRSWNFGDGSTSTSTNPSHSYTSAGTFTVSLTVTGTGGSDTETKTNFITVTAPAPVANFSATPTSGQAPLNVSFTDTSTGSISSRSWNFGDGSTSTSTNPSHTYSSAGTFTVSLTVTGSGGSDTETKTNFISVTAPPAAPVAGFNASPTSGPAPLNVTFTDASTGSISSRSWSFGDGGTSTATNPTHSFAAGTYTVTLTVTGSGGSDTETKTNFIVSIPPPVANFTATPTSGQAPLLVSFTDTSTGASITARTWNFGDGTTSTATNPTHTFSAGTYTVSLTVTGSGGSDTETKTNLITVTAPPGAPVANFSGTPTTGQAPLLVTFTDSSTGSITTRSWNFGDGGTSTATNPTHTFAAGTYTVSLTVTGSGGSDVETKVSYITVSPPPTGNFVLAAPTPGTAGVNNTFTVSGATPNSVVGFYIGTQLGSTVITRPSCPTGITIGIGTGWRLLGTAKANASGVATLVVLAPATSVGKTYHFQCVDQIACAASNLVTDTF